MVNLGTYSFYSHDSTVGFDIEKGECQFIIDEIKDSTLSGDGETVWQTGKQGRKLSAMKRNKTNKIEINNGYIVGGLMAQQFGDSEPVVDHENASIVTPAFEYLTADATGKAKTEHAAVGLTGNEIGFIYKANANNGQGEKYAQAATAGANTFAYDPATNEITLPTGVFSEGDQVIVFYDYKAKGIRYANRSDSYAGDLKLVSHFTIKDDCTGKLKHAAYVMPRVTLGDGFSFKFGGDQTVHDFSAEAVSTKCSQNQEYGYFVFPED